MGRYKNRMNRHRQIFMRIECKITGRVQMVMFRDFAQRKARKFGLCGFVRNNADGSVAVVAEGTREKLEDFLQLLDKGSVLSRVDDVEVEWKAATGEYAESPVKAD